MPRHKELKLLDFETKDGNTFAVYKNNKEEQYKIIYASQIHQFGKTKGWRKCMITDELIKRLLTMNFNILNPKIVEYIYEADQFFEDSRKW